MGATAVERIDGDDLSQSAVRGLANNTDHAGVGECRGRPNRNPRSLTSLTRKFQSKIIKRRATLLVLLLILSLALAVRLDAVRFGLPNLYDPDEPMFMLVALKLLTTGTLNPGWFGHPGSTTIYLVAMIDAAVAGASILTGKFASIGDFRNGVYADPSLLFVPARTAMVLLGVAAVWMTYVVARRLFGRRAGLIAAAILAINPLHIAWSAIVRTDIHASVFMLASLYFAIGAAEKGKLRDYLLAGLFAGFATATKWPAATVFVAIIGAAAGGVFEEARRLGMELRNAVLAGIAYICGVFLASPFIFLDWRTVIANVSGELKPGHLAHTGHGFPSNLWWYVADPIGHSMGVFALLCSLAGLALVARRPVARWTILPAAVAFIALISGQKMIWARWVLPVLPMFAIFAAVAIVDLCERSQELIGHKWGPAVLAALAVLAIGPAAAATAAQIKERSNDTRMQASRWAKEHIPPGSRVGLEDLEFGLLREPWRIIFPVGEAGCVDARKLLHQRVGLDFVQKLRAGSPIVDFGNVSSSKLGTCRADFFILTYYDLYLAEDRAFPREVGRYRAILAGGRTVALFKPSAGISGGPIVRIVAVGQH